MGAVVTYQQKYAAPAASAPQQAIPQPQYVQPDYGVLGSLAGAAGMYALGNQVAGNNETANNTINGQIANLSDMYGPNSPYAVQLRHALQVQDAKAGRNSQYGTRNVELQARLAGLQGQNAQTISQLVNAQRGINNNSAQIRAQQLASLFNVADKTGLLGQANRGLEGMFGLSNNPFTNTPQNDQMTQGYGMHQGIGENWDTNPTTAYGGEIPNYGGQSGVSGLYTQPDASFASNGSSYDPNNSYSQPSAPTEDNLYPWGS